MYSWSSLVVLLCCPISTTYNINACIFPVYDHARCGVIYRVWAWVSVQTTVIGIQSFIQFNACFEVDTERYISNEVGKHASEVVTRLYITRNEIYKKTVVLTIIDVIVRTRPSRHGCSKLT